MRRLFRPLDPLTAEVDRLARLMSVHSSRILERTGMMTSCGCDLCRAAARKLGQIERAARRGRQDA